MCIAQLLTCPVCRDNPAGCEPHRDSRMELTEGEGIVTINGVPLQEWLARK